VSRLCRLSVDFSAGDWLLLAQESAGSGGNIGPFETIVALIGLALFGLMLAGWWMVFEKAGVPGWTALVPLYHLIVILEIAGKPWWWIIFPLIPGVNIVVAIIVCIAFARRFGKGVGFALGLTFLPFIFYPILGFGDAKYLGPEARAG